MALRLIALAMLAFGLAACAAPPSEQTSAPVIGSVEKDARISCVPFARDHSQVKLYGDAWTWWDQAAGKYAQGHEPSLGSVMVLTGYAGPEHGHVAVVRQVISPREIRVDHANWLNDGAIYFDDPVMDVSAANDWSEIRVFNIQTALWGNRTYAVQGFIGGRPQPAPDDQIARLLSENS
jgi:hypothetical protein